MKSSLALAALASLVLPLVACSSSNADPEGKAGPSGGASSTHSGGSGGGQNLGGVPNSPNQPCTEHCAPDGGGTGLGGEAPIGGPDGGAPGLGGQGGDDLGGDLSQECELSGRGVRTSSDAPSARIVGVAPGPIETLRVADESVYVAGGDEYLRRLPLGGGDAETVTELYQRKRYPDMAALFEVVDDYVYYAAATPSVVRVLTAGSGIEVPAGKKTSGTPLAIWPTEQHLIVWRADAVTTLSQESWGPYEQRVSYQVPGPVTGDTFDGRSITWVGATKAGPEVRAIDLISGQVDLLFSKKKEFLTESSRGFGADCAYVYLEVCETSDGQFCTVQRVSRESGDAEPFAALTRVDAPDYALAADGALFFGYGAELFRVAEPGDEPERVWHDDSDVDRVQALHFAGSTLYVATGAGADSMSTVWEVEL